MDREDLKYAEHNNNNRYLVTGDEDAAHNIDLTRQPKHVCYAEIWSSYNKDGFQKFLHYNEDAKTALFSQLIWGECWDYKEPYLMEVTKLFNPLIGPIKVIAPNADISGKHGRYILEVKLSKDTSKTLLHAYMVFMRHAWEFIHIWPVQMRPPSAKQVWNKHLETNGRYGLAHSNFYRIHGGYSGTGPAGYDDRAYIEQVPNVWKRWAKDGRPKQFCHESIFDDYTPSVKEPMARACMALYKEAIADASEDGIYDPFKD